MSLSTQKPSYRFEDSIFLGHNLRKMRDPKKVLLWGWTPLSVLIFFDSTAPWASVAVKLGTWTNGTTFALISRSLQSLPMASVKGESFPFTVDFMHCCQTEIGLCEFTAIMWSIEWDHSTAERPTKSSPEEGRFPGVHSYAFLNN